MGHRALSVYLDQGTLELFAQQIIETVDGAKSVAVHDRQNGLVWPKRESCPAELCDLPELPHTDAEGHRIRLGTGRFLYAFYLRQADEPVARGTLSVLVDTAQPAALDSILGALQPVLACLERQLSINTELSAVRRLSDESQADLGMLVELDQLVIDDSVQETMSSIAALCRSHFGVELAAIILPDRGVQEVSRSDTNLPERSLMAAMGKLLGSAKLHRKVLIANGPLGDNGLRSGLFNKGEKILCSPVVNSRDEIEGILVLVGAQVFVRREIRLARAICAKIAVFAKRSTDTLASKLSRQGFARHTDETLRRHPTSNFAVLYFDMDRLHVINDSFGHDVGDEAIARIHVLLGDSIRSNEIVAHLSGDRFAVFLHNCDEADARKRAATMLESLRRHAFAHDGKSIQLSASIGIAVIPTVAKDATDALTIAEVACRSAKDRGGGRVVVFQDVDASIMQRRSDLDQVGYFQNALLENRFILFGQRIMALHEESSAYRYEILVRMRDLDGEILTPARFISAAERYQMMSALDRWVIKHALEQLAGANNTLEISLATFCINISAQSLADEDFLDYVISRIHESGVTPDALCFEITETALVRNLDRAQQFVRELRKLGCRFALDDFGTGYSSFAYLKTLPVQYIKIDGVFVRDLLENNLSEVIVSSAVRIARVIKASTVGEHVENDLVDQKLKALGVDYAQGFGIERPRPLADILDDIDQQNDLDLTANIRIA